MCVCVWRGGGILTDSGKVPNIHVRVMLGGAVMISGFCTIHHDLRECSFKNNFNRISLCTCECKYRQSG